MYQASFAIYLRFRGNYVSIFTITTAKRKDCLHVNINIDRLRVYPAGKVSPHLHTDIELLYILEGTLKIQIDDREYTGEPGDLFLINSKTEHSFSGTDNTLISSLYLDYYELRQLLDRSDISFSCNSVAEPDKNYSRHRFILDTMLEKYTDKSEILNFNSLYYSLLQLLKTENMTDHTGTVETKDFQKLKQTLNFIETHYMDAVSLTELAQKEYLSVSAFSRLFKKVTGNSFTDYIKNVRLSHAEGELLNTNKTITDIAADCGFSNLSAFNKVFRQSFHISPKEYRKKMRPEEETDQDEQAVLIRKYFSGRKNSLKTAPETSGLILVDLNDAVPFRNNILSGMNAGKFAELLEGKVQRHVETAVKELGLKYIRIYNPFDTSLQIRSNHETKHLNFEKLDTVLDFLVELGCNPIIELPDRKKKLVINIGRNHRQELPCPEHIFLSIQEWEDALSTLLDHIVKRYTVRRVSHWRFEIWYDSEHITGSGQIPYPLLYERTHNVIRRYIPHAQIGGSGLSMEMEPQTLKQQLLWWKSIPEKPDFLTFISYPYLVRKMDGPNYDLLKIESDLHWVKYSLDKYRALLKTIDYPETPIWIVEWNTSLSERNVYNDSCAKACHMLTQMTDTVGYADAMFYSNISDCISQYYDSVAPLIGATGLLTRDGLMKPAYYAMEFWRNLGDHLVKRGQNYIITTQNMTCVQMIVFNAKKFAAKYYTKNESQIRVEELPYVFQDNHDLRYTFELNHVPEGKRKICIHRISEAFGNVLAEWGKLGYTDNLMRSEISYLKKICIPRMEVAYQYTENGKIRLNITLKANEIALIQIL